MSDKPDILDRLQGWADKKLGDPLPNDWGVQLSEVIADAIAEIRDLRSLAGAAKLGPGFREFVDSDLQKLKPWLHQGFSRPFVEQCEQLRTTGTFSSSPISSAKVAKDAG